MDENPSAFEAVEYSVRLVADLTKLGHAYVLQLWWDMSAQRKASKGETCPLELSQQLVGLVHRVVQRHVPVDVKEIILSIGVNKDVIGSHSSIPVSDVQES